jgi:hypothetical protein
MVFPNTCCTGFATSSGLRNFMSFIASTRVFARGLSRLACAESCSLLYVWTFPLSTARSLLCLAFGMFRLVKQGMDENQPEPDSEYLEVLLPSYSPFVT